MTPRIVLWERDGRRKRTSLLAKAMLWRFQTLISQKGSIVYCFLWYLVYLHAGMHKRSYFNGQRISPVPLAQLFRQRLVSIFTCYISSSLVEYISVVTSSSALDLLSLESLFTSLSNNVNVCKDRVFYLGWRPQLRTGWGSEENVPNFSLCAVWGFGWFNSWVTRNKQGMLVILCFIYQTK